MKFLLILALVLFATYGLRIKAKQEEYKPVCEEDSFAAWDATFEAVDEEFGLSEMWESYMGEAEECYDNIYDDYDYR